MGKESIGCHLAHLLMSRMVLLANVTSPGLEVFAPFFDQGCISVCGDALYIEFRHFTRFTYRAA